MHYHRNAKTNLNQRQKMKESSLSSRELEEIFCVSHVTCCKWKNSDSPQDGKMGPKTIHYAVDQAFWKIIKKVRLKAKLTLDELVFVLQPYFNRLNRSNCYRILKHYCLNRLTFKEEKQRKKFASYKPGFIHIDIFYLPRINQKRYYCFLAIDRTTRLVYLEIYSRRRKEEAADFLVKCLNFFPYQIHHILTDNGREFTMKGQQSFGRKCKGETLFEIICELAGIKYRRTKIRHPWTNGMAERMVRTTKEHTVKLNRYENIESAIVDIENFQHIHNFRRKLKVLNYKTPFEVTMEWFVKEPNIFFKNPDELLTRL